MIDFYTYGTINGKAVAIALAMMDIKHEVHVIDLTQYEQRSQAFLKINPSGRIPVIVDHDHDTPLVVTQTGAILMYLAEKMDQYLGSNHQQKAQAMSWLWFQLTDISTNVFNNFYLKSLVQPKQAEAGDMLKSRAINFYKEFDQQLAIHPYIAGDNITVADLAAYPVVTALKESLINRQHIHLRRWYQELSKIPAIQAGMQSFD